MKRIKEIFYKLFPSRRPVELQIIDQAIKDWEESAEANKTRTTVTAIGLCYYFHETFQFEYDFTSKKFHSIAKTLPTYLPGPVDSWFPRADKASRVQVLKIYREKLLRK